MKVVLYATQTINGYIATETDETPWSVASWKNYYKITKDFKAQIIGRRTYQIMSKDNLFKKIGNPYTVVVSNFSPAERGNNIAYAKSPIEALEAVKDQRISKVVIAGGGKLNASFMKVNLVDEVWLDIEPLVFGSGTKLFYETFFKTKLKLMSVKKLSENTIHVRYKVLK